MVVVEDAGLREHGKRWLGAFEVELVTRPAVPNDRVV